jgi:hypothetical protein
MKESQYLFLTVMHIYKQETALSRWLRFKEKSGTADLIVPFNHSERLYEKSPPHTRARPLFIDGMGHNNVHASVHPMFVECLTEYLEEHVWPSVEKQGRRKVIVKSKSEKRVRVRLLKNQQSTQVGTTDSSELIPRA